VWRRVQFKASICFKFASSWSLGFQTLNCHLTWPLNFYSQYHKHWIWKLKFCVMETNELKQCKLSVSRSWMNFSIDMCVVLETFVSGTYVWTQMFSLSTLHNPTKQFPLSSFFHLVVICSSSMKTMCIMWNVLVLLCSWHFRPNNMFFNLMFVPDYDYAILSNLETKSDNESCLHLKLSRLQM
jgi:hypothetical protein